eukprot:NODE_72_length_24857_cov_0.454399.p9 type:complete len:260 gc:universal NODE_72_length_24857_cov_0.454399:3366-4145(+)
MNASICQFDVHLLIKPPMNFNLSDHFILSYVAGASLVFNIQYGLICLLNIYLIGKTRINMTMFILTFFMLISNYLLMMRPNLFNEPISIIIFQIGGTLEGLVVIGYTPVKFKGLLPNWMKVISILSAILISISTICLTSFILLDHLDYINMVSNLGSILIGVVIFYWCQKLYLKIFKNPRRDFKQKRLQQLSLSTIFMTFLVVFLNILLNYYGGVINFTSFAIVAFVAIYGALMDFIIDFNKQLESRSLIIMTNALEMN